LELCRAVQTHFKKPRLWSF